MLGNMRLAQALVEKGMLDSLMTGFSDAMQGVEGSIQDHPWFWGGAAVLVLAILLRTGRKF
jgi:hypothetical protein